MLQYETIAPATLKLLQRIQAMPEFADTRLVGGTSLALQLGHRISVDLDLFGKWSSSADLFAALKTIGNTRKSSGTPDGRLQFFFVDGIKVDCVDYSEFPWIDDLVVENGVRLAGIRDIGAMKINAITNRGTRKDFVDLAFLLKQYSLSEIFNWYQQKYSEANPALALRSMSYFVDAEAQPLPRVLQPFSWEEAKDLICKSVREIVTGR